MLGNKTGITKERRGLPEESGAYTYGYDALGRLSEIQKDRVAGTYYAQAREYQPDVGRFQGMDRIVGGCSNPECFNGYIYQFKERWNLKFILGSIQNPLDPTLSSPHLAV